MMNILQHLKQSTLYELFDKPVKLTKRSFKQEGDINLKTYRTKVNGEAYRFDLEYHRPTKTIEFSFRPESGKYEDMPNDGRVFDVLAKLKFFIKDYISIFAKYIEANKDEWAEWYYESFQIGGFRFVPIKSEEDNKKDVDVISRKRARLYLAFFKKAFNFKFNIDVQDEYVYLIFDELLYPTELLPML